MEHNIQKYLKEDREKCAALLMEQYAGLIWSVCAKRLQNEEDIKECVNGVFAEFFLHPERYDSAKGSIRNYLCEIAEKRAIDTYRKNIRIQSVENEFFEKNRMEQEAYTQCQEDVLMVQEALDMLEPIDSQILRMKYYDGMTYSEIAQNLGMTYESAKKRGLRGKQKLLYIILVGLILAFLVACAAIIFKEYQFSPWKGFIWSDETAYELKEGDLSIEVDGVVWHLKDAIYCDGRFEIEFLIQWEQPVWTKREIQRYINRMSKNIQIHDNTGRKLNLEMGIFSLQSLYDEQKMLVNFDCKYVLDKQEMDQLTFEVEIEENNCLEFHLQVIPVHETEISSNEILLSDGSKLIVGQGYIGDSGFSIVNLHHGNIKEYVVSELVTNSYMGTHGKGRVQPYLIDSAGKEYQMVRDTWEDMEQMGIQRMFNLYFAGVGEGEYTLHIPRLCIQKKMSSEKVRLTLPTEDTYVKYNQEVLFPDGTGFRITGITREYEKKIHYDYDADGSFVEEIEENYLYCLEYEPIMAGGLEYLAAQVEGDDLKMNILEDERYCIVVPVDDPRTQVEVQFVNPYYMVNESHKVKIKIGTLVE